MVDLLSHILMLPCSYHCDGRGFGAGNTIGAHGKIPSDAYGY